jgi:hypothetical protein
VLNNTTLLSLVEIPGLGEDQQQRSSDILDIHNSSGSNNYNNSGLTAGNVTSEVRIILRDISGKFVWDTSSLITSPPPPALYDQMNGGDDRQAGLAKKPPKKKPPKKTTKNVFFWVFFRFFKLLIFMKILQTFLFETHFL